MLHAPTSETKANTAQSKTQLVPQPERELHPHLLRPAGLYSPGGMNSTASSSSSIAQRHPGLAGMQSAHGNQAVLRMMRSPQQVMRVTPLRPSQGMMLQRKCACGGSSEAGGECAECKAKREEGHEPVSMQTKLQVSQPGDRYEQEAEHVSDQVMRMAIPEASITPNGNKALVRQVKNASADSTTSAPPTVNEVVSSNGGQPLDEATRAFMEPRFGHDFSQVRVYTDAKATESARAVNALAYTVGRDVVFGTGQYTPGTSEGRRLMAHELTHVVQQADKDGAQIQRLPDKTVYAFEWEKQLDEMYPLEFPSNVDRNLLLLGVFGEALLSELIKKIYASKEARQVVSEYGMGGIVALGDTLSAGSLDAEGARKALEELPKRYSRTTLVLRSKGMKSEEKLLRLDPHFKYTPPKPSLLLPGEQLSMDKSLPQIEWEVHPHIKAYYGTWQVYAAVRDQVAKWRDPSVDDPDSFIEEAIQQWNANKKIHTYFGTSGNNFDGNPERSYLNLKRLYRQKGIADPASYFKSCIKDIVFYNVRTEGHQSLRNKLETAQKNLGGHFVFQVAGMPGVRQGSFAFVPRTQNGLPNTLSNHALGTAIDLNPDVNPQIKQREDILVINAVCNVVLPHGLLHETGYTALKIASDYFRQHFDEAWVNQQEQLLNQMQLQHPRPRGLSAQEELVRAIHRRKGKLYEYAAHGFLDLTQQLVEGLQAVHLQWGGEYPRSKDFMHFEDLNTEECVK